MARKRKKAITRKRKSVSAPMKRKSSRRRSSGRGAWGDWQGIAFAGIGYGLISRVIRSVLGSSEMFRGLGGWIVPVLAIFINNRFFGNPYISVLAINDATQMLIGSVIPGLAVGEDLVDSSFEVGEDLVDSPFAVGQDDLVALQDVLSPAEIEVLKSEVVPELQNLSGSNFDQSGYEV